MIGIAPVTQSLAATNVVDAEGRLTATHHDLPEIPLDHVGPISAHGVRMRPLLYWLLPMTFAACGGIAIAPSEESDAGKNQTDGGGQNQNGNSGSSGSGSSTNIRIPLNHRAAGETCPSARGAGSIMACDYDSGPPPTCLHDSDCTSGANGRCETPEFIPLACQTACSYDECASDSDCPSNEPCDCRTSATDSTANVCVTDSACRIDSDCGSGGYCSPSAGFGSFHCETAYFCHTAKDTCVDDTDCGSSGKCEFITASGIWACGGPTCEPPP
jgi:hypothetical protein